jgi:hypothetical protein
MKEPAKNPMVIKVNFESFRIFENHGYIPNPVVWIFSPPCNWGIHGVDAWWVGIFGRF